MRYEDVPDFYKTLGVSRDANTSEIDEALQAYEDKMRKHLIIPHLMTSSRRALNEIIPALKQALLSGPEKRKLYTQHLETVERRNGQTSEATDGLRLDYRFRSSFYFDLYNIDTEVPANTLREMAVKLDREWVRTRDWLTRPTRSKNPLVLFIKHNVLYTHLDNRINEEIIQKLAQMDIDEAIERCLYLLNPELERPMLAINTLPVQGDQSQVFYLRDFLPDEAGPHRVTLTNSGPRGCLFGTVESLTNWATLPDAEPKKRFCLRPGNERGASFDLPLFFETNRLARNTVHTAKLLFHIENYDPPMDVVAQLAFKLLPLPPRVTFEPSSTRSAPLMASTAKRGMRTSVTTRVHNSGDEALIPLVARLSCADPDVLIDPPIVHANQPVTITIETYNRAPGSTYNITVHVDYSRVRGAKGVDEINIQGEILPTIWGSMVRKKPLAQRTLAASGGGLLGAIASIAAVFITQSSFFLGILLLTLTLYAPIFVSSKTFIRHRRQAGETTYVPDLALWSGPIIVSIFLALLDAASLTIGVIMGGLIGCALCFIADWTTPGIAAPTLQQATQEQSVVMEQHAEQKTRPRH